MVGARTIAATCLSAVLALAVLLTGMPLVAAAKTVASVPKAIATPAAHAPYRSRRFVTPRGTGLDVYPTLLANGVRCTGLGIVSPSSTPYACLDIGGDLGLRGIMTASSFVTENSTYGPTYANVNGRVNASQYNSGSPGRFSYNQQQIATAVCGGDVQIGTESNNPIGGIYPSAWGVNCNNRDPLFALDGTGNVEAAGHIAGAAHNVCSAGSGVPCGTTAMCALSGTSCVATAAVPAASICTVTANGTDTTNGVESFKLNLSSTILNVRIIVESSQSATAAVNITCD